MAPFSYPVFFPEKIPFYTIHIPCRTWHAASVEPCSIELRKSTSSLITHVIKRLFIYLHQFIPTIFSLHVLCTFLFAVLALFHILKAISISIDSIEIAASNKL